MSELFVAGTHSGAAELIGREPIGPAHTALVWCSNVEPGGMERVALSIANGLAANGWHVIVAGPFSRVPFLRRVIRPEIEFIDFDMPKSVAGVWRAARFLSRIVRERGVEVISAHGSVFPLLPIPIPVVWTEHDVRYGGREMLRGARGVAWRRVRRRIHQGDWRLVTVSRYVQTQTCRKLALPDDRATVVYNGLPNAAALHRLPAPEFKPPYRIGYVGRLVASKRPEEVFELSALLNHMGIPHVWKVFGDGHLMPEMRKRALRDTGHSVEICGLVERPEDAFRQLDVLCFHGRGEQEGLGMVLIEALAANRPVVAWDAGCIREVLTGRGNLVPPPFSLRRFAATIAGTLLNGPQPRLRDDRWSEARMIADYEAILRDSVRAWAQRVR